MPEEKFSVVEKYPNEIGTSAQNFYTSDFIFGIPNSKISKFWTLFPLHRKEVEKYVSFFKIICLFSSKWNLPIILPATTSRKTGLALFTKPQLSTNRKDVLGRAAYLCYIISR